jgi:hypothetical protein
VDIMLDLAVMTSSKTSTRKRIVAEKFLDEVPQIIAKYKFKEFDLPRFSADLRNWFKQNEWF